MTDPDWDLGLAKKTVTLAMPRSLNGDSGDPVEEIFRVTNYEKGCVLRATRPRDHVDLTFHIRGLKCSGLGSSASQPRLTTINSIANRKLLILFPPQHIAEQIKDKPLGDDACQSAEAWGAMRVRMSRPSRLVFSIPKTARWTPRILLDELTDWSSLIPIVHKRADIGVEIAAQLEAAFPGYSSATLQGLDFSTAQKLIVDQFEGPNESETALEMAGRLIFSPSSYGRWIVPDELPESGATPLWTARLDRAGRSSIRALWSTRLEPLCLPTNLDKQEPAGEAMLSLDRQNHWDIVLQTSIYGWPALRNLAPEGITSLHQAQTESDTVAIPKPTVVRPDAVIGFLNEIDTAPTHNYANQDSGIAIARPFEDGDISVSALGGLTAMTWRGDPPSIFWTAGGEPTGVLLERLFYRGYLGRDTEVVAVEKGYLFPLGIRASLLTVCERMIYPDYAGNPVSYLIRRRFIVTPRKPRSYPGPYQPFEGREFPPRRVQLKTLVTPDLAKLVNVPLQLPPASEPLPNQSIFWPQMVQGSIASDILFEWSTEDAGSVRSKLIFVLNNVVGRQDAMRALVDYYNGEIDHRRTAWLGGARHHYAEPNREGDTSFDTTSWLLSAQGRRDGLNGEEHFACDGRMEGASQPPFYPMMDRGFVSMQSVEQMLGLPHGQVEVRYFDGYKRDGIDTDHEIFLTLRQDALALRASAKSERSGGIASPDLNVAAISRLTGPVGGKKNQALLATGELDFGSAAAGAFDPAQFFGDAKLLGVVLLSDIVKVATAALSLNQAPQLIDETLFGARADLELVQKVASGLREALYGADGRSGLVARLEAGIAKADNVLAGGSLSLADVYPSLTNAMAPLRGQPAEIKKLLDTVISAKKTEEVRTPIGALVPKVRTLLDAIADVIKDPVPDAFEKIITTVRGIFETLFRGAEEQVQQLAANAFRLLLDWLKDSFCDAVDTDGFGSILFGDRGTLSCAEIFADPRAALNAISEGLYGAVFNDAWASLAKILVLETDLRTTLDLELDQKREAINIALRAGVALIASRLAVINPALEDVRDQAIQDRFVSAVIGDLTPLLQPHSDLMTPQEALDFASDVLHQFPDQARASIENRLRELLATIWPIPNIEAQLLLDELSDLVRRELKQRLIDAIIKQGRDLVDRLTDVVAAAARSGYERILNVVTGLFDAIIESSAIAAIAKAGRATQAVCDAVGDAAKLIGDGVMAANAGLEANAQEIIDAAKRIQVPADPVGRPLRVALASLTSAAEQALAITREVNLERQKLGNVAGTICSSTRAYLDPVAAIIRLRESVTGTLTEIARQCEAIDSIFSSGQPTTSDRAALEEAIGQCATLASGITGINELRLPSQTLDAAIVTIQQAGLGTVKYRDSLVVIVGKVTTQAAALYGELGRAIDPGRLRELLEASVRQFQSDLDRNFAAFLLQSVGFTPSALAAIEYAAGKTLSPFVTYLLPIYDAVEKILATILDPPADPVLRKVYGLALGGDAKVLALQAARASLGQERTAVKAIAQSHIPNLDQVTALVVSYRNGGGALPEVIKAVEALGLTDVGQTLTEALCEELRKIEEEMRALVLQLVPTKLQTRYFWPTQLKRFPDSDEWVFNPSDTAPPTSLPSVPPTNHPASNAGFIWHLWIDGRFSFDIVTGQREVEIVGILRPFELRLLGKQFEMLTIAFDETRFTSKNGAAPDFAVKVKDVKIGPYLEFVKTLQEWLAPQGSGFYLKPTEQYPGVEVGYIYDAGIIQIGTLQFINVAFRIAAILPFSTDSVSGGQARFVFALASRERPFLISSPPYGGGGWVTITCTSEQVESLDLAFVFGGVAAIKFGPLDAQGRIVAGIRVQSLAAVNGKRAHVITAIFEAVGEGNIACFSICVSIRVTLTQTSPGGALYGETTYRFSFKVGFLRLTYSVSARYRLSNGSDPQALEALGGSTALGVGFIQSIAPNKETEWQAYRRHFDLELLEAA